VPVAKTLRVLVVDDQESMRGMMRAYVRRMGVENVDMAESGSQALQELMKKPYNLVISDFHMVSGSGLDLLKGMRAHPVLKKTPVIMVTGNSDTETVSKVVQAGVNGYVVKPVSFEAIKARVEKILGPLT
jgi:two-component system, chemotaxis family, chemotaxis protein CheY